MILQRKLIIWPVLWCRCVGTKLTITARAGTCTQHSKTHASAAATRMQVCRAAGLRVAGLQVAGLQRPLLRSRRVPSNPKAPA